MEKLESLKAVLVKAVKPLAADPTKLAIFVDRGRIAARAGSLSFEYRYSVNLVVEDYAGSTDAVVLPILAWIAEHQPEQMQKGDSEPFTFECELLDGDKMDLSITLEMTERVKVERVPGGVNMTHLSDTLPPDTFTGAEGARLWTGLADDLVAGIAAPVIGRP